MGKGKWGQWGWWFVLGWLLGGGGQAWAWPLPDTGQTTSYQAGDDASYSINPPSYTKLASGDAVLPDTATAADGWLMTRDNVTCLVWEMKTADGSLHDQGNTYTWEASTSQFIAELNGAQFAAHADWRLPTVKELSTLVHSGTYSPAIDQAWFPNTVSSGYWSSTALASSTGDAWGVNFYSGGVGGGSKGSSYYVRAVRGGQCQ